MLEKCLEGGLEVWNRNQSRLGGTGKTKKVAGTDEHPLIVGIPDVVGVAIIAVEPQAIVIVFHIEHVEVAVRIVNA